MKDKITILAIAALFLFALQKCGSGSGDEGSSSVQSLTSDYGSRASVFTTMDSMTGDAASFILHSNGREARVAILPSGKMESRRSMRLFGQVIDSSTIGLNSAQVNLDGDGTFNNNDIVGANGLLVLTGEMGDEGYLSYQPPMLSNYGEVVVGSLIKLSLSFGAVFESQVSIEGTNNLYRSALFD